MASAAAPEETLPAPSDTCATPLESADAPVCSALVESASAAEPSANCDAPAAALSIPSESKPAPDCYLKAAARFGLDSSECVVFEDSFNGLKAGRAAEMYVVGLATTNSSAQIAPFCDEVIPVFLEWPAVMIKNKKRGKDHLDIAALQL